ncbi:hypothetical protein [Kineosporia sp. NBRC 101731]|uniref:hypothetical protein n=1 Tax=Kineosporia sp. NBRC 101731 TaxID=3032199 RepID=UPI0025532567|nr:hypothetical protein [Kineosporia sp. NBRC 101731]
MSFAWATTVEVDREAVPPARKPVQVSTGYAASIRDRAVQAIAGGGFLIALRALLVAAPVVQAGETFARAAGSTIFVHVACTPFRSLFHTGDRSSATIDAGQVLDQLTKDQVLVRDGYIGCTTSRTSCTPGAARPYCATYAASTRTPRPDWPTSPSSSPTSPPPPSGAHPMASPQPALQHRTLDPTRPHTSRGGKTACLHLNSYGIIASDEPSDNISGDVLSLEDLGQVGCEGFELLDHVGVVTGQLCGSNSRYQK